MLKKQYSTSISLNIQRIAAAWRVAMSNRQFTLKMVLTPGLFCLYSAATQHIGAYVEMRHGTQLADPLLSAFPLFDFSSQIFILLYVSLALAVLTHLSQPRVILRIIEMHFAVAIVRQLCILALPLEPPAGIIVLRDIFLENTVYPHHSPLTKDLFFSGHVASIGIYFLCATKKYIKAFLALGILLMSFMILCMHVHYTYDVYGALMITGAIFYAPSWIARWREKTTVEAGS